MSRQTQAVRFLALVAVAGVVGSVADAQTTIASIIAGPAGPGTPGTPVSFTVPQDPVPFGEFHFGSSSTPIPVQYANGAGPFEKHLAPQPDQNFDGAVDLSDIATLIAGPPLVLNEHLTIAPNTPWTDWHEEILTPGWQWGSVSLTTPNNTGLLTGLSTNVSANKVDFFFDPLPVGTQVHVRKELSFVGQFSAADTADFLNNAYRIRVSEYPTAVPEPGAVALVGLALGGVAMVGLRRRWDAEAVRRSSAV